MRWIKRGFLGVLATMVIALAIDVATFDRTAALRDYSRIKQGMAQNYANLDWQVDHRRLDLTELDRQTEENLNSAHGRVQAYFAFHDFVAAFRDPHLRLGHGAPPEGATLENLSSLRPEAMAGHCKAQGYEAEDHSGELDFASLPNWRGVESAHFPAGSVGQLGVLRIAEFGEARYLAACQAVMDSGLAGRDLQLAVRAKLQADLRRILGELTERGVTTLAIDLTDNGGGTEWSTAAAALFSEEPLVRAGPSLSSADCDRTPVWRGEEVCPILTRDTELQQIEGEGAWTGPILLLVNHNSGSATEEFAVWLRDNNRALLVGQRTAGAGCGYVAGGAAVEIESLPLHLMMPNCARFTVDGINEIEGLDPDIPIDWSQDDARQQVLNVAR